jgi:uncharacterized protein (DUF433 family)
MHTTNWVHEGRNMATTAPAIEIPIHTDDHGTIRVGNTRVTLDIVIARFQQGNTPEQINQSFPTLKLGDIYAVISYYLQNQPEIDAYLLQQDAAAEQGRRDIEAGQPQMLDLEARLRERITKRD